MSNGIKMQPPPGTKRAVTFDTGVYRQLDRRQIKRLREYELKAGVFALANPIVIQELVAHLASEEDADYKHCMSALVKLAEHTLSHDKPDTGLCLLPDVQSTVCRQLFRAIPAGHEQQVRNLSSLAVHLRDNAPTIADPRASQNFKLCADFVEMREKRWVEMINISPDLVSVELWISQFAAIVVIAYATLVGQFPSLEQTREMAQTLIKIWPAPFHLAASVKQKISRTAGTTGPSKKLGNFTWDFYISFCAGRSNSIGDADIYLVSGDHQIKKAAQAAGCPERVISLHDHMKSIGLD